MKSERTDVRLTVRRIFESHNLDTSFSIFKLRTLVIFITLEMCFPRLILKSDSPYNIHTTRSLLEQNLSWMSSLEQQISMENGFQSIELFTLHFENK